MENEKIRKLIARLSMCFSVDRVKAVEEDGNIRLEFGAHGQAAALFGRVGMIFAKFTGFSLAGNSILINRAELENHYAEIELVVSVCELAQFVSGLESDSGRITWAMNEKLLPQLASQEGELCLTFSNNDNAEKATVRYRVNEENRQKLASMLKITCEQLFAANADLAGLCDNPLQVLRAIRVTGKLISLYEPLKYFEALKTSFTLSRTGLSKWVLVVENRDPTSITLAHNFLRQNIALGLPESPYQKDYRFWIEIDADDIVESLDFLEFLPLEYERYESLIKLFRNTPGISRVKIKRDKLRLRCNYVAFRELCRLAWAFIPITRTSGTGGRAYSNRIYFSPADLYRQFDELMQIHNSLVEKYEAERNSGHSHQIAA